MHVLMPLLHQQSYVLYFSRRLAKKSLERVMRFEDYECSWPRIAAAKMLLPQYLQTRDTAKLQVCLRA